MGKTPEMILFLISPPRRWGYDGDNDFSFSCDLKHDKKTLLLFSYCHMRTFHRQSHIFKFVLDYYFQLSNMKVG